MTKSVELVREDEYSRRLEILCGSIDKAFRLMNIHEGSEQDARPKDVWKPTYTNNIFRKRAKCEGYSTKTIEFYLEHFVG